jgi:hypothetical protein
MPDMDGIKALNQDFEANVQERQSFISHWRELSEFGMPRKGRFLVTDRNKGDKAYQKIINSTATRALKIARAGMLSGVMSPATEWFVLGVDDPGLMEYRPVREYLYQVQGVLNRVFNSSNLYSMAPQMLGEMIQYGTGCMYQENDFDNVSRFFTHTVGSYALAQTAKFKVDTVYREWQLQTRQIVKEYGYENCSDGVKNAWDRGNYTAWFTVRHCVKPNEDYSPRAIGNKRMKFVSVHWEPGQKENDKYLRVSGYRRFPYYTPRWDVTGEDIYGTDCPGMTALGDVKGLQIGEKRQAQGIDLQLFPPMHGPTSLRNKAINQLPGRATLYDAESGSEHVLRPVYEFKPDIVGNRTNIKEIERRINQAYHVDLFLAISEAEGIQPKNQLQLQFTNQERLLQLGPVLTHLFGEFLNPLIDNTYDRLVELDQEAGGGAVLPIPPPELRGREIRPTYISTLAVAQRAASLGNIERAASFVGSLVGAGMTDNRKFDADQAIDEYSDRLRIPPGLIRSDDEVAALRQQDREAQEQMATLQMAKLGADAAKTASETRTSDGKSVLDGVSNAAADQGAR